MSKVKLSPSQQELLQKLRKEEKTDAAAKYSYNLATHTARWNRTMGALHRRGFVEPERYFPEGHVFAKWRWGTTAAGREHLGEKA